MGKKKDKKVGAWGNKDWDEERNKANGKGRTWALASSTMNGSIDYGFCRLIISVHSQANLSRGSQFNPETQSPFVKSFIHTHKITSGTCYFLEQNKVQGQRIFITEQK